MNEELRQDLIDKIKMIVNEAVDGLEPEMDRLIRSGCGILEDHDPDSYLVPKAFVANYLKDFAGRIKPTSERGKELMENFSHF